MTTYDVLIQNGRIVDGRGNPWYCGEVAVQGGRLAAVGRHVPGEALARVDAQGMFVCPGFIDTHTHSDYCYLVDPTAQGKVRQGVTTEVTGNCGMSAAPWLGAARHGESPLGLTPTWTSVGDYLEVLTGSQLPVNLAPLVGHGTLRGAVVGQDDRPATSTELAEMERLLSESLETGAWGMSLGLYFAPGMYAPREELTRLAGIVAVQGGILAAHIRDEGTYTVGFLAAVRELLGFGAETGVRTHISHIKAHGPEVWGASKEVLTLIEEARSRGIEVSCDQYPYEASGGMIVADTLPHAFQAGKSPQEISYELAKPEVRARLHDAVAANVARRGGATRLFVSAHPLQELVGQSIQELADHRGVDPAEVVMEMLAQAGGARASWTCFSMSTEDVERFMRYPGTMFGSDGSGLSTTGPLSEGHPHPRNYGTFPHVLRRYVKDEGTLRLEDAIRKMTSLPAQTFSIPDRGTLEKGKWADLVIFDLDRVTDATFEKPKQYPSGIPYVMVNGRWVIEAGQFTGNLPGLVLRRS